MPSQESLLLLPLSVIQQANQSFVTVPFSFIHTKQLDVVRVRVGLGLQLGLAWHGGEWTEY